MTNSPRIPFVRMYRRRSKTGNWYYIGTLGRAKLLGFEGKPTDAGTEILDFFIVEGDAEKRELTERPKRIDFPRAAAEAAFKR